MPRAIKDTGIDILNEIKFIPRPLFGFLSFLPLLASFYWPIGAFLDGGTQRGTIATDLLWADVCTVKEDNHVDSLGGFGPNERGEELVVWQW